MRPPPESPFESGATVRAAARPRSSRRSCSPWPRTMPSRLTVFAQAAAARAPHAEVRTYPGGHFDIYVGTTFERAVADQVEFLTRHLLRS